MEKRDLYNGDNEFVPFDFKGDKEQDKPDSELEHRLKTDPGSEAQDKTGVLESILTEKANYLKEILGEIEGQISDREKLLERIGSKIDSEICYLRTKLYELDNWGVGNNKSVDTRRLLFEKEIEALKSQKRIESRESWRDISLLRKEHREFFKEYRNAVRRVKIVLPEKNDQDGKEEIND